MSNPPKMEKEEKLLRRMLWLRHDADHFSALYGDDGEMACNSCGIDFLRFTAEEIEEAFIRIGMAKFLASKSNELL